MRPWRQDGDGVGSECGFGRRFEVVPPALESREFRLLVGNGGQFWGHGLAGWRITFVLR